MRAINRDADKNRRSSVTYSSIRVFTPHAIPSSRTTKYAAYKTRNLILKKFLDRKRRPKIFRSCSGQIFSGNIFDPALPNISRKVLVRNGPKKDVS